MSLKIIHIIFITLSVMISIGFGVWGLHSHMTEGNPLNLVLGISSLVLGGVLVVYGIGFLRKMKELRIS